MKRARRIVLKKAWSLFMTGFKEHSDDKLVEYCDDNGMEHCDEKSMDHCDEKGMETCHDSFQ